MVKKENLPRAANGKRGSGKLHSTVKKVDAMNRTDTTPQQFNHPDQAQAARGNGPVSLPGEQPESLGRSADAGVNMSRQGDATPQDWGQQSLPANIPNIPLY